MMIFGSNIGFAEAVTPHDTNALTGVSTHGVAYFLYVGVSGDVAVTTGGVDVTFTGMSAGTWHPLPPFTHVKATNTTATNLVAGY